MRKRLCCLAICFLAMLFFARPASAVVLGQLDDFETGMMSWNNPAGLVQVINGGGPTGANDDYLQVTAIGGSGQGSRLVVQNFNQWLTLGLLNYVAQGVTTIEFDLINQGAVDLSIRLAFKSMAGIGSPGYLSAAAVVVAGSGWQHFTISIAPADLIALNGPDPYNIFFSGGVGEVRIIHEVGTASLNGDPVTGVLGIDNIRAVPEPTFAALAAGSLFVLAVYWLRARQRAARR